MDAFYRLTYELHASHANIQYAPDARHFHTFTLTLFLKKKNRSFDLYQTMEQQIWDYMDAFQNCYLGDMELFQGSDLTIESLGDIFFLELSGIINSDHVELVRLNISENPVREYSVTRKMLDASIHPIRISPFLTSLAVGDVTNEAEMKQEPIKNVQPLQEEMIKPQAEENVIQNDKKHYILKQRWKILLAIFCFIVIAFVVTTCLQSAMIIVKGSDTLCHIYRADLLLAQIKQGNLFPLYDPSWYNGVEIMRYWGPLPLYLLAFLQFISESTALDAGVLLVGINIVIGACGWLLFGIRYKRIALASILGIMWFFLPENMRILSSDGNIPRVIINVMLPYLLYFVWRFVRDRHKNSMYPIILISCLIVLCHLGMALMMFASILLMLLIYSILHHEYKNLRHVCLMFVISILLCGIWVYPALQGGAAKGGNTNQVMATFFQPFTKSLDIVNYFSGDRLSYYIGISMFILCVIGVFMAKRKQKALFIAALFIFLSTTNSAFEIYAKLPLSQYLWMFRFAIYALAFVFMGFLLWDHLRKGFIVLMLVFMSIDMIPAIQYVYSYHDKTKDDTIKYIDELGTQEGLKSAKKYTVQRLALMDLSAFGAFAPYYITKEEPSVNYMFGAGWEGAAISDNMVRMNTALNYGHYEYLFDRALELGNDTVSIYVPFLAYGPSDIEKVKKAAAQRGYELVVQERDSMVFHYDVEGTFGTKRTYECLAIGSSAQDIAMLYPVFEEGRSNKLDDYTLKDLKKYKKLWLSGFTYSDKSYVEDLLRKASKEGVEVYIDMSFLGASNQTTDNSFLDVKGQLYTFQDRFSTLMYDGVDYRPALFDGEYRTWQAVALTNVDKVDGYTKKDDRKLVFSGTSDNENLHFVGFNLVYHAQMTNDKAMMEMLDEMFQTTYGKMEEIQIVPLHITYDDRLITIQSPKNDVNTTLASLDIFSGDFKTKHNLVEVNKGTTQIKMSYPYLLQGSIMSIAGLLVCILYIYRMHHHKKEGNV